jgi:hypothetical protein
MFDPIRVNRTRKSRRAGSGDLQYYAFVEPKREEPNTDRPDFLWRMHEAMGDWRPAIPVHPMRLDDFCEDFGLDLHEMLRVANGEIAEHKGWTKAR